jgi:hypothetical protein
MTGNARSHYTRTQYGCFSDVTVDAADLPGCFLFFDDGFHDVKCLSVCEIIFKSGLNVVTKNNYTKRLFGKIIVTAL